MPMSKCCKIQMGFMSIITNVIYVEKLSIQGSMTGKQISYPLKSSLYSLFFGQISGVSYL